MRNNFVANNMKTIAICKFVIRGDSRYSWKLIASNFIKNEHDIKYTD